MRHLYAITAVGAILMIAACQGELPTAPESGDASMYGQVGKDYGQQGDGTVSIPFKASFYSTGGVAPNAACGAFPNLLNTQNGEGEGTSLGKMSFHATFCQNIADYLDGTDPDDTSPWYSLGYMIFTAADGDELWLSGGGEITSTDKPGYDFQFIDPFEFVGGTGRFEGASGTGVTESYVRNPYVDHYWSGTLILPQGAD